jgi:nucleoside-diphosphate-sugar epimerase
MRFLITGGAGFIGSHIVEHLLQSNHQARVLDNFTTGKRDNLAFATGNANLEIIEGDIRDADAMVAAVSGVDGVFHEAALVSVPKSVEQPALSFDINVKGTFTVFDAARLAGVRRVVYASSAAVYGDNEHLPLSETEVPIPLSPYGLDKLYTEHLGALYQSLYGQEMLALRYFNVFGPRQDPGSAYSGVISIFVDHLKSDKVPRIYGDGEQTRDFVYVGDIVQANLKAMFSDYAGFRVFNVGCGRQTSLNQLLSQLKELTGSPVTPTYADARVGDVRHSLSDISKIQKDLGYAPAFSLAEGLRLLLESVR